MEPLAVRIGRVAAGLSFDDVATEVISKAKLCLLDMIGCACEAQPLPWSMQACGLAVPVAAGGATVVGMPHAASATDAAFANGVMAHGLVREDMHPASVSHLGMVLLPALLALAESRPAGLRIAGRDLVTAAVLGYEVGGQIGRAVVDSGLASSFRPSGITGPAAAAAAGARLLGLDAAACASAVALAANSIVGLNEWAHTGGSEMFFHGGFAARNAVTAVLAARQGAFASPSVLDGQAGLFAALGRRGAEARVRLFESRPEILAVYHKPLPVCNFAQTATQAALVIAREHQPDPGRIDGIVIRVPRASALYPGCDFTGPFATSLQAKMSIQYCVASALLLGGVAERDFDRREDPLLRRLVQAGRLQVDEDLTQAFPARQGAEVEVRGEGGACWRARLDDLVPADEEDIRRRFRIAAGRVIGTDRAARFEELVGELERLDDVAALWPLLRAG